MGDSKKVYEVEQALDGIPKIKLCKDCIHYTPITTCKASFKTLKPEFKKVYLVRGDIDQLSSCTEMRSREDLCGTAGKLFVGIEEDPKGSWFTILVTKLLR